MRVLMLVFLVSWFTLAMPSTPVHTQDSAAEAALASVISDFERILKRADPITAGLDGDRDALRRLPDPSRDTELANGRELSAIGAKLAQISIRDLSSASALNHQVLSRAIAEAVEQVGFDFDRIAFQNDDGFHTLGDYLGRTTTIASRDDADAWLARVGALPAYYSASIGNLRRGIETRLTQPTIVVNRVLEVARRQADTKAEQSPLLLPFSRMPAGIPPAVQADYRDRALAIVRDRVLPAERAFATFLAQEYAPAARSTISWRTTPNGETSYRFLVRRETTTGMTPDEIHQLGKAEVARIRALMDASIKETGYAGTFAGFLQMLRSDPRFYPKTPQELLEKASEIAKRADDGLPPLFGTLPRLWYGVRPVPADIAEGYTTGRYWPGSMVAGQAGGYMVNTSNLDQRALYELPALTCTRPCPAIIYRSRSPRSSRACRTSAAMRSRPPSSRAGACTRSFWAKRWGSTATLTNASGAIPTRCGARAGWWPTPVSTGSDGTSSRHASASPRTPHYRNTTSRRSSNAMSPGPARRSRTRSASCGSARCGGKPRRSSASGSMSGSFTMCSCSVGRCRSTW